METIMKKKTVFISILLNLACFVFGQDLSSLLMNKEIKRVETYRNGSLLLQNEYITNDGKIIVYSTDIQLMKVHINREYVFGDSCIEINNYYPDGYRYGYTKYTYLDGLVKILEYENFEWGNSERIEYFYDLNGKLLRVIGNEFEKKYVYSSGNIISIETVNRRGERRVEEVKQIDANIVYTPSYDLYIRTDRKVIENRIDGDLRTTTIIYFLNEQIFEKQIYIYLSMIELKV